MSKSSKKFQKKIAILSNMKGSYESKRQRALHQMNMTGDEWVEAKAALHMHQRDVETDKKKRR